MLHACMHAACCLQAMIRPMASFAIIVLASWQVQIERPRCSDTLDSNPVLVDKLRAWAQHAAQGPHA